MHFTAFAILGFLAMGSAGDTPHGFRPKQAWLVCLLVGLYGISDEFHQYFIPGRTADALDVAADIAGGVLGTWLMYLLVRMASRRRQAPAAYK